MYQFKAIIRNPNNTYLFSHSICGLATRRGSAKSKVDGDGTCSVMSGLAGEGPLGRNGYTLSLRELTSPQLFYGEQSEE